MLMNPRLLDQRVQHVQHTVRTPHLAGISEQLDFFVGFGFDFRPPDAEGLELVDEFVDDVPEPLFGEFESYRAVRVYGRKRS